MSFGVKLSAKILEALIDAVAFKRLITVSVDASMLPSHTGSLFNGSDCSEKVTQHHSCRLMCTGTTTSLVRMTGSLEALRLSGGVRTAACASSLQGSRSAGARCTRFLAPHATVSMTRSGPAVCEV